MTQKIYEVDSLTCSKCKGRMRIIAFIEEEEIIEKLLRHLGLWEVKARPPPRVTGPPKIQKYKIDYSISQFPVSDKWLYVDPKYPEVCPA